MENLSQVSHKFAEEIYKEAQAKAQAETRYRGAQMREKADDDVADAEVVDQ